MRRVLNRLFQILTDPLLLISLAQNNYFFKRFVSKTTGLSSIGFTDSSTSFSGKVEGVSGRLNKGSEKNNNKINENGTNTKENLIYSQAVFSSLASISSSSSSSSKSVFLIVFLSVIPLILFLMIVSAMTSFFFSWIFSVHIDDKDLLQDVVRKDITDDSLLDTVAHETRSRSSLFFLGFLSAFASLSFTQWCLFYTLLASFNSKPNLKRDPSMFLMNIISSPTSSTNESNAPVSVDSSIDYEKYSKESIDMRQRKSFEQEKKLEEQKNISEKEKERNREEYTINYSFTSLTSPSQDLLGSSSVIDDITFTNNNMGSSIKSDSGMSNIDGASDSTQTQITTMLKNIIGDTNKETSEVVESCLWLRVALSSIYLEHVGSETVRTFLLESIQREFEILKQSLHLESLEVVNFEIGQEVPQLNNVRIKTSKLSKDTYLVFDFFYNGGASIKVKAGSFGQTVSLGVSIERISGKLITEVVDWPAPYIHFYFYTPPMIDFQIEFGDQSFKRTANLVTSSIKKLLKKHITFPNGYIYHCTKEGQQWYEDAKLQIGENVGQALTQPGLIIINITGATSLPKGNYICKIKYAKQTVQTKIQQETKNPSWNESFVLGNAKGDFSRDKEEIINIRIRDVTEKSSYMGWVDIPICSLCPQTVQTHKYPLFQTEFTTLGYVSISFFMTTSEKLIFLENISRSRVPVKAKSVRFEDN